ncbi:MAG: T9SS type A sorting domain-containing protein [Bacteroidota bacterium]|nr:T9SS type A sorting domain-containing protein [Bacteroidota bacterium]
MFLVLFSELSFAQLNGTYTINCNTNANADYHSFSNAIIDLENNGINGNVVFIFSPGTYQGHLNISNYNGISPTNTITFKSSTNDSNDVIITHSPTGYSDNFTLQLNNANYIKFENLTIRSTVNNSYSNVISFRNNSQHNVFKNCVILGMKTSLAQSDQALIISDNNSSNSSNTFQNNLFKQGSFGIYFQKNATSIADSSNLIINNTFLEQYKYAIYLSRQENIIIDKNIILQNSSTGHSAIKLVLPAKSFSIQENKIITTNESISSIINIYNYICSTTPFQGIIANNFISSVFNGNDNNIIDIYNSKSIKIYNNSINHSSKSNLISNLIKLENSQNIEIKNNILASKNRARIFHFLNSTNISSNHNCFFITSNEFAIIGSDSFTNFKHWQDSTSFDNQSIFTNPFFHSITNLHTHNQLINNSGTPLSLITTDIDGEIRNNLHPDIGADEFSTIAHDISIIDCIYPTEGNHCQLDSNIHFVIKLLNLGTDTISNIPVKFSINNSLKTQNPEIVNSLIFPFDTITYNFTTVANLSAKGGYDCKIFLSDTNDNFKTNDTFANSISIFPIINSFPFIENFETGHNYSLLSHTNSESKISIDKRAANNSNYGLHFQGDSSTAWTGFLNNTTAKNAWIDNTEHQATSYTCNIDASSTSFLRLCLDLKQTYSYAEKLSWFRVIVNDTIQIPDINGDSNFNPQINSNNFETKFFDLSNYTDSNLKVSLQSCCKRRDGFYNKGDNVFIDNIKISIPPANDVGVLSIISPFNKLCGKQNDEVKVIISNFGSQTQSSIPVHVKIFSPFDTLVISDTLRKPIKSNCYDTLTIRYCNTSIAGDYIFKAYTSLQSDNINKNDTTEIAIVFISPSQLPLIDNLEKESKQSKWELTNSWFAKKGDHGTQSQTLSNSIWIYGATKSSTFLNQKNGPISKNSYFHFDYRIIRDHPPYFNLPTIMNSTDSIYVLASSNCGISYDTIFVIDSTNHQPSTKMKHIQIPLKKYDGEYLLIGFSITSDSFNVNYIDFDSIVISILPETKLPNDTSICIGDSFTIIVKNDSNMTYSWRDIGSSTIISNNYFFTTYSAGTFILKITNDLGWANYDTITITNFPQPNANAGIDQEICFGDSLQLTATGGTKYLWNTGSTTNELNLIADTITEFSVKVFNIYGCYSFDSVNIKIKALPQASIVGDTSVCFGDTVTLTAFGGGKFKWNTGDTTQNISTIAHSSTQFSVKVIDSNNCWSIDSIYQIVKELPKIWLGNDTIICGKNSITLNANKTFDSYFWSTGNNTKSIIVDSSKIGFSTAIIWIKVIKDACKNFDTIQIRFYDCVGINEEIDIRNNIKTFPNPAKNNIIIKIKENYKTDKNFSITIFDNQGKQLYVIQQKDIKTFSIDISKFKKGLYLIKITNKNSFYVFKFIKS